MTGVRRLGVAVVFALAAVPALGQQGGELHFALRSEPKTLDPMLVADDASETVRYLTGGVLIRLNRQTQQLQPELATAWKITNAGRTITFTLRPGVRFSDGTTVSTADVVYTLKRLFDPATHSPTADSFRSGEGAITVVSDAPNRVTVTLPAAVAGLDRLFDEVAIIAQHAKNPGDASAGPFAVAEYKAGVYLLLKRNWFYWKKDEAGKQLPYLDSIRLDIQQNRETEALRFRRGELHLINNLSSELFDSMVSEFPSSMRDLGPSLDGEQLWFNQATKAQLPEYKLAWFRSAVFRRAVSSAVQRADICRLVYGNHATPAIGPISPANRFWFNTALKPRAYDPDGALAALRAEGFTLSGATLRDREGHVVEFSIITNAGNDQRLRIASMVQQDLAKIGMKVNVVTLDFPSLIDRISESFNYEAVLLGLVNSDLDPNAQMNVWLSSGENHQWNPREASPATAWEAEIDRLMREQASSLDPARRKKAFDAVQKIAWEQEPFIYLINKNALAAVSNRVRNANPVAVRPQTYWNIERMMLAQGAQ